ncbi:MAG: hypothetical protein K2G23_08235 [Muribaculaceae bacterium]|nr:hypothetical protein [Muribaculaceae bacterium]
MRRNRLNLLLMLFLAMGMALVGCRKEETSESNEAENPENTSQMVNEGAAVPVDSLRTDSLGQTMALSDTVKNLKDNVYSLSTQLKEANAAIDKLSEQLEKKETISGVEMLAIGLGFLGLLAALFSIFWCVKLKDKSIHQADDLKKFRFRLAEIKPEKPAIRPSGSASVTPDNDLTVRVSKIETSIRDLYSRVGNTQRSEKQPQQVVKQSPVKTTETVTAYFGNPSRGDKEGYFKKDLEYRDSDARFVAKIQDGKASFSPLIDSEAAKKTLLSSDQMKLAVEFTGCAPSDMQTMSVTPGIAVRQPGGRWVITQKSKVELK